MMVAAVCGRLIARNSTVPSSGVAAIEARRTSAAAVLRWHARGPDDTRYKPQIGPASTPMANQHGARPQQAALSARYAQRPDRRYDCAANKPSRSMLSAKMEKLAENQNTAC